MPLQSGLPPHLNWLRKRSQSYKAACGKDIEVWDFSHANQPEALSAWAAHFRNHYCLDEQIDLMRGPKSRAEYLNDLKFPTLSGGLGPATRAGDFGEILVADFLQWIQGFWVPRVRWSSKIIQNESPKGSDVIGFRIVSEDESSAQDTLAIFETKTKFSATTKNRLQDAINDSAKDHIRLAESLNFIKQKMLDRDQLEEVKKVERFQSPTDFPYQEIYGAVEIMSSEFEDEQEFSHSTSLEVPIKPGSVEFAPHPNRDNLKVIVISGLTMMQLVHNLYKLAADEA